MAEVLADTNSTSLYYSEEAEWNEEPLTPTMKELQRVSDTLQHQKNTVVPATIRTDRLNEDIVDVGAQASGGFAFELRYGQYDDLISAVMGSSGFETATLTASDISASAADQSFNTAAGDFVAAGYKVGMWISVAGFTGPGAVNNDFHHLLTVTATKMTTDSTTIVDAVAGASIITRAKRAVNGVVKRSFLFEKRYNDIGQYQIIRGMRANSLTLEVRASQIITGNIDFMGARGLYQSTSIAGVSTAAPGNPAFDASSNVYEIVEGGGALTSPLQSFTITINANAGVQAAIANKYPVGIRFGTLEMTGTVVAYFQDLIMLNKFVNHTPTSMVFKLRDLNGRGVVFTFFRIFFAEGQTPVPGQNQDVFLTMPFRASYDPVTGLGMQYDSLG